jgi:hypothetical protein
MLNKKIWANFQRVIVLFTEKMVKKLLKLRSWGSGIRKKPIPDPGSRGQKGTGSRIRNTGAGTDSYSTFFGSGTAWIWH